MWRKRVHKKDDLENNSRINIVLAIIFLFTLVIILRLYNLQIVQHDFYSAIASGQHQTSSILTPERGQIFMTDSGSNESKLYPFATNKNFALVFVIPKEISPKDWQTMAEKLYIIFDKETIEEEVIESLEYNDQRELSNELAYINNLDISDEEKIIKRAGTVRRRQAAKLDSEWLEIRKLKIESETESEKDEIIEKYLRKIRKENDPYEPIEHKVSGEKLLELYALIGSNDEKTIDINNLDIKNSKVIFKDTGDIFNITGLSHSMEAYRYYPENNIGSHLLGFVSLYNGKKVGNYGLEEFFNEELFGKYGSIKAEKGASGSVVIINDREYNKSKKGSDLLLTIDRSIQYTICNKLEKAIDTYNADSGSVVIVEPKTGAIISMCSFPDFDPNNYNDVDGLEVYNNPAIFSQYEPGSVFKTITLAIALDKGKITPYTTYNDKGSIMIEGWNKPIKNADFERKGGHGVVTMNTVLEESLNTGAIFAMLQVGADIFSEYVQNFGFGEKTGIELGSESAGNIDNLLRRNIRKIDAATSSFGQGIAVTPLQMTMSYAAIANKGVLVKPYIVKEIISGDDSLVIQPRTIRQVISEETASQISAMLVNVVDGGHAKKAGVDGYYVGGKTGTAQIPSKQGGYEEYKFIHTFVGMAPIDDPKFVMLVKLDNPKGIKYSSDTAAPLFGEIADFLLRYYQVSKDR